MATASPTQMPDYGAGSSGPHASPREGAEARSGAGRIIPVIMCGGSGTRLWPASRESMPKQFIPFLEDLSCFQTTAQRFADSVFAKPRRGRLATVPIATAQPYGEIQRTELARDLEADALVRAGNEGGRSSH